MNYTLELVEQLKKAKGLESDYAVAKALKLHPNRISNYRTGKSHADDKMAVVLADELGLDRLQTIARINADRAGGAVDRAFWKRVAAAASFLLASMLNMGVAPEANAATGHSPTSHNVYTRIRRTLARLLNRDAGRPFAVA